MEEPSEPIQPCHICGTLCLEFEEVEEDWFGRGRVVRIWAGCDEALDYEKDEIRTEFGPLRESIEVWNEMQTNPDSEDLAAYRENRLTATLKVMGRSMIEQQ
jgi:hypothetical protein